MTSLLMTSAGVTKGVSDEQVYELEQKFKRYETIINAMTPEERSLPDLIAAQVCHSIVPLLIENYIM